MKNLSKSVVGKIYKILFAPVSVRHCSQTIYECLHGCMRMYNCTGDQKWRLRAEKVKDILVEIQQKDGGFDIGYEFNFSYWHKVGESTSPELRALMGLYEYSKSVDADSVEKTIKKAADWIKEHSFQMDGGRYAIPYGPYSSRKVTNYNAVSFAMGAAAAINALYNDNEMLRIYKGFCNYLAATLSNGKDAKGRFWYYSDQEDYALTEAQRSKIDYYHMGQQLEVHALAEQWVPLKGQVDIIRDVLIHILDFSKDKEVIPYCQNSSYFGPNIHVWGLGSIASGCLEAAILLPEFKKEAHALAAKVAEWLIRNSWNGGFFIPIVSERGEAVENRYMVRSDAWVFNSLSACKMHMKTSEWDEQIELCWQRMEMVNFSGPETHAINPRRKQFDRLLRRG